MESKVFYLHYKDEISTCPSLLIVLISLLYAQDDCSNGSCHPTIGDLLLGRSGQLTASSTCGLNGPQNYCIIGYLEGEQKCFQCDSRYPYNPYTQSNSHPIENVITTFEPDRKKKWWQSENGIDHVSIRLDLETLFQFSHLILSFKTFRPAAMLVERSRDYGLTWKVFRYFAQDCTLSFPSIPMGQARNVGEIVCDSRYSDTEPSTEGEVVLKALDPSFEIENPYSPYIQDLITLTNLRINFTKLHTLGDTLSGRWQSDPFEKYYYALYEMVVRGNCFCNGHARQCDPVQNVRGDVFNQPGMVHGRCICQHNTDGMNCERCKEFYNDAPWRPAQGSDDTSCRVCNCNGHSERCHFDMAVYLANNGQSGGVCEDCQHHTTGHHCDQCKPFYYRDPTQDIADPRACIPCDCELEGTMNNGMCQSHTNLDLELAAGTCPCKQHVEGVRCNRCKPEYFGLSANNPLGCQPCNCNRMGSLQSSTCDPVTGECHCRRFAMGIRCDQCFPGYWGLGVNSLGCSPCDCDIGGAHSDLCSSTDGQCECLPNIIGRQCNKPAVGYFFVPLDYYIYEAESALPLAGSASYVQPTSLPNCDIYFRQQGIDFRYENGKIILNRMTSGNLEGKKQIQESIPYVKMVFREPSSDKPVTWTGPGFASVLSGAGLRFTVNNIPYPMDFVISLRYEPQSSDDWKATVVVKPSDHSRSEHCSNKIPMTEARSLILPAAGRFAILQNPICLEPDIRYLVDVYFSHLSTPDSMSKSQILIDSLGLIPKIDSLSNMCSKQELEEYHQYQCIEVASAVGPHIYPDVCERLIVSMSARMHNGAVQCRCDPQGSLSLGCSKYGGQCECKPNVVGRCCNACAVGTYGFEPHGCSPCDCHTQGSFSTLCDQITGQCSCHSEINGRRCDQCLSGYFGFPNCRPCQCNGYAELCHPDTGVCRNCKGFTAGHNCERCADGYYGNPLSRQPCRPCMCPDSPASNRYFAYSCYQDLQSSEIICNCREGYSGNRCDGCPPGFYGYLRQTGDQCLPCLCNNNIDITDAEACDKITGECLKCLHNTHGGSCQFCKPGYFGSALAQTCRKCVCNPLGTHPETCPSSDAEKTCTCDQITGQCPCLPNVIGINCDQCASGYWNMAGGRGCQPCGCDLKNSQSNQCNQFTSQCLCKAGFAGKTCNECEENYYGNPQLSCILCKCNLEGTNRPACDRITGSCNCRAGVTGRLCDQCARGFSQEFPTCSPCHHCFDHWDGEIMPLSRAVQELVRFAANLDQSNLLPGCDAHFSNLEDKLRAVEKILKSPTLSSEEFLKVKDYHDYIRQKFEQLDLDLNLFAIDEFPNFNKTINKLHAETDKLFEDLEKIKQKRQQYNYAQIEEAYNKISKHYQTSSAAAQKANDATPLIKDSSNTRKNIRVMLNDLASKKKLNSDQLKKIKVPEISKLNEKVCGARGDLPCAQAHCGGALCRDRYGKRKCGGQNCNGALPLSSAALKKANDADSSLRNLTIHVQESEYQIAKIRKIAKDTKVKASKLNETLVKALNQTEREKEHTKDLINKVKQFLLVNITGMCACLDPGNTSSQIPQPVEFVPPEDIEKVANKVLAINLPAAPKDLISMLNKIKNYCDDYARNENKLKRQLQDAQNLAAKAKEAEKAASALQDINEIKDNLNQAQSTQRKTQNALNRVNNDIQEIRAEIQQAQIKANIMEEKLKDFEKRHADLEDEILALQTKTFSNRDQAEKAKAEAKIAQDGATEANMQLKSLKDKYATLKNGLSSTDHLSETLDKIKKLKEEAENLVQETNEKIQRIADLEKKINDLNKLKEEKADQLQLLEKQVIDIRNEIVEQENKYATCKS
ncbi:laminin subunit beta-4 [Rhinatrema bivittatum]|uniref:laminin subunit beta-4 n=1 Tax=Rhinatrema bivittatum TaxID=194408 RepID=UPI001127DE08|nr:laminin subunit beta-4 [Rhinatrema bivittatum]